MASMLKVSLVWWEEPSGSDVNCDGIWSWYGMKEWYEAGMVALTQSCLGQVWRSAPGSLSAQWNHLENQCRKLFTSSTFIRIGTGWVSVPTCECKITSYYCYRLPTYHQYGHIEQCSFLGRCSYLFQNREHLGDPGNMAIWQYGNLAIWQFGNVAHGNLG